MQQVQYSKMCITLKCNFRIDWKFGNKLILPKSSEQCYKNIIPQSRNGPLKCSFDVDSGSEELNVMGQPSPPTHTQTFCYLGVDLPFGVIPTGLIT